MTRSRTFECAVCHQITPSSELGGAVQERHNLTPEAACDFLLLSELVCCWCEIEAAEGDAAAAWGEWDEDEDDFAQEWWDEDEDRSAYAFLTSLGYIDQAQLDRQNLNL